jgi:hypothetical protein
VPILFTLVMKATQEPHGELVAGNVVPSAMVFIVLMEAISSSKTPAVKKVTRHHISEDDILQVPYVSRNSQLEPEAYYTLV